MITHEEAEELVERIYVHTDWETKDKLLAYISQQEKNTELLGLYKKLLKYIGLHNSSTYCSKETIKDLKQKVKDTQKEIDKLETELGK